MPSKRVNMRDVAKAAGVTPTTVSLVLRNDRRISEATREKVLKVADKLGYRPNPMVSALMSQVQSGSRVANSTKLALMGPHGNYQRSLQSSFSYPGDVIRAMQDRAEELGYSGIDVFEAEEGRDDFQQVIKVIEYRGIKGVLFSPFIDEFVTKHYEIEFNNFAVVAAGYSQQIKGIHRVAHDQYQITFRMTQNILERGYKRIGLTLAEDFEQRTGWHYTGGFLGALQQNKKAWMNRNALFYRNNHDQDGLDKKFQEWIEKNRLECIITQDPSDYQRLKSASYKVPKDIGFALLSIQDKHHRPTDNPTGMYHDPTELGRAAVDLVTAQIARNEYGLPPFPKKVLTRPKWVDGNTIQVVGS